MTNLRTMIGWIFVPMILGLVAAGTSETQHPREGGIEVAARYHLRSRTGNFYNRARRDYRRPSSSLRPRNQMRTNRFHTVRSA